MVPAILVVVGLLFLFWVGDRLKRRELVSSPPAPDPRQLAQALEWKEGDASPNGRRVLWVQPAARQLLSLTSGNGAFFFAAGCPVDVEKLPLQLPEQATELAVSWPISSDETMRLFAGFAPAVMEDKWRIVAYPTEKALRVFFFRSWTGVLLYVLEVNAGTVNKLWAQPQDELAVPMAKALLDGYLLGRPCIVPALAEHGEDKLKLMLHGIQWAGRRCDGVEPAAMAT
ncbi:MAG TPA: hypothetical protein VNG33_16000 [Polyangiaceae bacterium]|nr:hypothetical protein [Polyangiaceae bacterium]